MRIAFDLTPIYDHLTGVERYNINITKEIIKAHPENQYILLFKNEIHNLFMEESKRDNVEAIIIPECNKLLFIQWRLYRTLLKVNADYYIFLSFTSPVLFKKQRIVNAIHDLTCWDCPETIPTKMKYYYRYTYKVATKRSWKIVTVSKFSQKRICDKYGLSTDKVPVIYDGLTNIFSEEPHDNPMLKEKYKLPDKYILSLSTIEPRKNLQLLIRAYKKMVKDEIELPDLVLAGRSGWKLEDIMKDIDDKTRSRIHFTGFIDEEDLAQIYRDAELFVFPSKYEGFGIPVIEAMSQETLVVCSDATSLPEVVGEAGVLFQSENIESLKLSIGEVMSMEEEQIKILKEHGLNNARNYSWDIEARKLYNILLQ